MPHPCKLLLHFRKEKHSLHGRAALYRKTLYGIGHSLQ